MNSKSLRPASGPSDKGWQEIRVGIALTVLAITAVVLRFVARIKRRLKIEIDDWFALAGLIFVLGMFVEIVLWATIGNNGKHIEKLTSQEITTFLKVFLANEMTYSFTSPTIKLSIIFFYRRLFSTRQFQRIAKVLMGAVVAWGVATFLAAALQCRPLYAFWDPAVNGHCFNALQYILGVQGVNIALDFAILCLPMPLVWSLRRPWQDKVALSVVFLLGGFVCAASIYRIVTLLYISNSDLTYTTYLGTIWTFVEPCIGLVCGCLPIIRGLFPAFKMKKATTAKRSNPVSNPLRNSPTPGRGSHHTNAEYLKMDTSRSFERQSDADTDVLVKSHYGGGRMTRNQIVVNTTFEVV